MSTYFTGFVNLCFNLLILRRLDFSAAIRELFSFLGIGIKHFQVQEKLDHKTDIFVRFSNNLLYDDYLEIYICAQSLEHIIVGVNQLSCEPELLK